MLWAITLLNSLAIVVLAHRLARVAAAAEVPRLPQRTAFNGWTERALAGGTRSAADMPAEYLVLFVREHCDLCHALLTQLAHEGRPDVHFVLAGEGNPDVLTRAASSVLGSAYDEYLVVDGTFLRRFGVASVPYAMAIRRGRIVRAGPARTPPELIEVAAAFTPMPGRGVPSETSAVEELPHGRSGTGDGRSGL